MRVPRCVTVLCCFSSLGWLLPAQTPAPANVAALEQAFRTPPDDARIMMRWWWFGPSVTKAELEQEMRRMKEGGIGGFEVQPVYPLAMDDPEMGIRNFPYLSNEFLDALKFTSDKARELGLRMDVTLGSGWPFGGPHIPVTEAAGKLRMDRVMVPNGAQTIAKPHLAEGEKLLATFVTSAAGQNYSDAQRVTLADVPVGRVAVPANAQGKVVLFFISSRTGMMVKRPSVNAEGFVLDHYSRTAIDKHLKAVGTPLLQALGTRPPFAVFSDSLEVFGSDWTPDLLAEFQKRRGYDLTPYLPALMGEMGEKTAAVRCDWGKTLTELVNERYLIPLQQWAKQHGTKLRSQTYGMPPVTLSSEGLVDLPEGEGPRWRHFSDSRWAASASHLYHKPVTSSETWTWLHSPAFRATPLDMKAEADLHFLQGITQLIGHGWAYSPAYAGEPGWRFYAAAVFNHHNPWWLVMPDLAKYMQRISYLMRLGRPAQDVAIYLPTNDARAKFVRGNASVNRSMETMLGEELIPAVLDAGYNFDFIDDEALEKMGSPYPIVILPNVERIPLAAYKKLQEFAQGKGIVLAVQRTPAVAPGLLEGERDTAAVQALSKALFEGAGARGKLVGTVAELGTVLRGRLAPDMALARPNPAVGFMHRDVNGMQVYFLANTSNQAQETDATFRVSDQVHPEWWDPFSGEVKPALSSRGSGTTVHLQFAPYESRVLVFSERAGRAAPVNAEIPRVLADLGTNWTLQFPGGSQPQTLAALRSWTDTDATRFFSGQATYEKTIAVPADATKNGARLWLDFGEGTPVTDTRKPGSPGMRALLESPVREGAQVWINGQAAGSVWRPPYRVDITRFVRAGSNNQVRVTVGNTAINELAGQTLPDDKLLNLRYGVRFQPQDMDKLQPIPAGLLGPIRLLAQ